MIASIIAVVITQNLAEGSIYTIKLKRKGINLHGGKDVNILNQLQIHDLKQTMFESVEQSISAEDALHLMATSTVPNFYVVDANNKFVGTLSLGSVRRYLSIHAELPLDTTALNLANTNDTGVTNETSAGEVLETMMKLDVSALAVVDENKEITGTIQKTDILRKYQELLLKRDSTNVLGFALKYIHHSHHYKIDVMNGFMMARIDVPSAFINQTVSSVNVRKKYKIEVLLIRTKTKQGWSDIMPDSKIKMLAGNQLLIFGRENEVNKFCKLN